MRKNFLLLFLLALLPMAGWAQDYSYSQTVEWKSSNVFSYSAIPAESDFPSLVTVRSTATYNNYGNPSHEFNCTSQGVGTDYPTANAAQYYYNFYASETATTPIAHGDLVAGGSYVLRLYVKYVSSGATANYNWMSYSWDWTTPTEASNYTTKTYNLPFSISNKPEVTVQLYGIERVWDDPWNGEPSMDDFNATPGLRQVTGATTNWNDVKDYLAYKRVDNGTDVGTYAYTLTVKSEHPSYTIHINDAGAKLSITQATNVAGAVSLEGWTYGDDPKTPVVTGFKYGNDLAEFTYSADDVTYTDEVPTDYGTYYVKATVPETINYTEVSAKNTFSIAKRDIVATGTTPDFTVTAATGLEYNENPQALLTAITWAGEPEKVRATLVEFSTNETDWFEIDDFKETNANVAGYPVYVRMTGDANHNDLASTLLTTKVPIAKKQNAFTTDPELTDVSPLVYLESDAKDLLKELGATSGGTSQIQYKVVFTSTKGVESTVDWSTTAPKGENAGTYKIYYKAVEDGNWLGVDEQELGEVEIEKSFVVRSGGPQLATAVLTFNAKEQGLLQTGKYFSGIKGGTVTYYAQGEQEDDATEYASYSAVKKRNADKYTVSYKFFADDSGNYKDDEEATVIGGAEATKEIKQAVLYIGGNTLTKKIEEVADLEDNMKPLIEIKDFLNGGAFIAGDVDVDDETEQQELLNKIVKPTTPLATIIANAQLGTNIVALEPQVDETVNYQVDAATLLSQQASLNIVVTEAAIQDAPVAADLTYTGAPLPLVGTAAKGYKAMGGTGTTPEKAVAIGKVVYSLTQDGEYTDDLTEIVETNAKDAYKVYYKAELSTEATSLDRFYEYTGGVKSIDVVIKQKEITADMFTLAYTTKVYNGENQTPAVSIADAEKDIMTIDDFEVVKTDGEGAVVGEEGMVDVDTYTFTFSGKRNYKTPTEAPALTFTITPKQLSDNMFVLSSYEEIYNREDQTPDVSLLSTEPITIDDFTEAHSYKYDDVESALALADPFINAGTYTFTFTGKGNYTGTASATFDITPAEVTDIVKPAAIGLTYNGKDQILAEPATFDDEVVKGTFKYSLDGTAWTANIEDLKGKNAGEYTIMTEFTPDKNHKFEGEDGEGGVVEDAIATINKATVGYNLGNLTKTWDGEEFGDDEIGSLFTLYAGGEGTKLFGDDEYDKPFVLELPEDYRDAGTYTFKQPTVTFKTKEGGYEKDYPVNYNVTFAGEAEVIINKADITEDDFTAPTAKTGLTYDPTENLNPQDLVNDGVVTAKYDEDYPTTELAGLAYGTFYYAQATTIPAIPETEEAWAASEDWNTNAPAKSDAGSYPVWYVVKGDKNHNNFVAKAALAGNIGQYELSKEEFLPANYKAALPYKGASYDAADFIPALNEPLIEGTDYEVFASEMTNVADDYTLLYAAKENSNYTGEFTVTVAVTPIDVIAVAPKGIKKVYDGTASLEGVITNEDITFVGVLSGDQIAVPEALALSTEGIAVSDKPYAITVDADAINEIAANKNYNILDETIDGTLTITKAPTFTIGFDAVPATWTKEFGKTDPALTGYTVKVTNGEFYGDIDDVLAATTAVRADGEDVGDYDVTLTIDETADVFANYEGVEFDGTAATFEITKAEKEYTVSIANITKTYKGEAFETAIEFTADDLVIAGYTGDKAKFFVDKDGNATLPTATLAAGAKNVGDYNITLSEGSSLNYNFTFVPATFTIEPVYVTGEIENKPVTAIGEDGTEVLKRVVWSVEAADAADATTVQNALEAELFAVQFTAGVVDTNNKIATEDGANALTLAYIGGDGNFEFETAVFGDLTIGETSTVIALDDSEAIETTAGKANVTFTQNRPVPMDTWQACVLPFTVSIEELSDVFGYAAVDLFDKDRTTAEEVHFSLQVSGSIEAGTPFLFKTNNDTNFTDVMFEGVNVVATSTLDPVVVDDKGDGADATGIKFIGTFTGENITTSGYRYLSKGTWYSTADGKSKPYVIKPLRSYLDMNGNASARIFIEEPDGTTSIMSVSNFNNMMNEGWYTIEGKKLDQAPTQKGVYIQNGKKVVIK